MHAHTHTYIYVYAHTHKRTRSMIANLSNDIFRNIDLRSLKISLVRRRCKAITV